MKINYERSLLGLINSIVAKFGLLPFHKVLPTSYFGEKFQSSKRVVLFLVDALGYECSRRVVSDSDLKYIRMPEKIFSVFPSTTVNALTTLSTGRSPIEHGMLGYILYLKEFGTLANMIEFSPLGMERDALISRGANPSSFLGVPTIYESLRNYGVNPLIVIPSSFKESGLSKLHNRGSAVQGYLDVVDMMIKLRKNLESEKFSYIYVYWPMVDAMGHTYGPNSEEYLQEAKVIFKLFESLVYDELPMDLRDETTFIITADHGQIHTPWQHEYKISPEDEFVSTLQILPTGEPRLMYLHTKDPSKTIEEGKNFFGPNVEFVPSLKLLEDGYFGPGLQDPRVISRIGDLVAIPKEDYSFSVKYTGNEHQMKGKHGGLSDQEMDIPLFVI